MPTPDPVPGCVTYTTTDGVTFGCSECNDSTLLHGLSYDECRDPPMGASDPGHIADCTEYGDSAGNFYCVTCGNNKIRRDSRDACDD